MADNSNQTSPAVSIGDIRRALADSPANGDGERPPGRYAAVAMVFAGPESDPELCFIRRAEREGDPWSGHMAFPGGMGEPDDASPRAAAQRETLEEVGLTVRDSHFLAALSRSPVIAGGADTGIRLFPFVFYLGGETEPLRPNREVAEAFWVPLSHILDSAHHVILPLERDGERLDFPSVRYRGHHIWGVTYRVLAQFAEALAHPLPPPLVRP
jgi:8-oxo-dGTP pyrophosphatase MutT (NUDIX family)